MRDKAQRAGSDRASAAAGDRRRSSSALRNVRTRLARRRRSSSLEWTSSPCACVPRRARRGGEHIRSAATSRLGRPGPAPGGSCRAAGAPLPTAGARRGRPRRCRSPRAGSRRSPASQPRRDPSRAQGRPPRPRRGPTRPGPGAVGSPPIESSGLGRPSHAQLDAGLALGNQPQRLDRLARPRT